MVLKVRDISLKLLSGWLMVPAITRKFKVLFLLLLFILFIYFSWGGCSVQKVLELIPGSENKSNPRSFIWPDLQGSGVGQKSLNHRIPEIQEPWEIIWCSPSHWLIEFAKSQIIHSVAELISIQVSWLLGSCTVPHYFLKTLRAEKMVQKSCFPRAVSARKRKERFWLGLYNNFSSNTWPRAGIMVSFVIPALNRQM